MFIYQFILDELKMELHILPVPGTGQQVCGGVGGWLRVVVGGGGWWWVVCKAIIVLSVA